MDDWQEETRRRAKEAGEKLEDSALDYFAWAKDNPADAIVSALLWFVLGCVVASVVHL